MDIAFEVTNDRSKANRVINALFEKGLIFPLCESKINQRVIKIPYIEGKFNLESPNLYGVIEIKYAITEGKMKKGKPGDFKKRFEKAVKVLEAYQGQTIPIKKTLAEHGIDVSVNYSRLSSMLGEKGIIKVEKSGIGKVLNFEEATAPEKIVVDDSAIIEALCERKSALTQEIAVLNVELEDIEESLRILKEYPRIREKVINKLLGINS